MSKSSERNCGSGQLRGRVPDYQELFILTTGGFATTLPVAPLPITSEENVLLCEVRFLIWDLAARRFCNLCADSLFFKSMLLSCASLCTSAVRRTLRTAEELRVVCRLEYLRGCVWWPPPVSFFARAISAHCRLCISPLPSTHFTKILGKHIIKDKRMITITDKQTQKTLLYHKVVFTDSRSTNTARQFSRRVLGDGGVSFDLTAETIPSAIPRT